MATESYYEKMQRVRKEQKARKDKRDKENAMVGGLDDGQVKKRAPKSKSSKLGSATPSKGSKNPTSVFQDMKKKTTKKPLGMSPGALGGKTKGKVDVGLSEALRKKNKKTTLGMSPGAMGGRKMAVTGKLKKNDALNPIARNTKTKVKATAGNTKDFASTMALQKRLIAKGAKIKADGIMGAKTRAAMKKFMSKPSVPTKKTTMVDSFKKSNVSANKNKKAGIDSAKGDNKKVKNFKKNTNPKLDSKGNYKGTNIKPTKLQLDRMNKRRAKKGST